jgi:hypothetical protein
MPEPTITAPCGHPIPESWLLSEAAKINARKRSSYTGGVVWKVHRPDYSRCRCAGCNAKRIVAAK